MSATTAASPGHPAMDYDEHERTYRRFLSLIHRAVITIVVVLLILTWLFL